ncbi:MAG TPA: hypothetical protein VFH50_04605 [Acidimicrobiales bacterium]|nr:hypothetical protein [Acidimicrobiales bacterium]
MSGRGSLNEVTLGDIGRALRRYQPFVLAVAAIVLVVAFLPGKESSNPGAASATGPGTGSVRLGGTGGQTGGGGAAGANGLSNGSGANGSLLDTGSGGGAAGAAGGGTGTTGGGATATGGTGGSALPAATSDPWCDKATGRVKLPSLYAPPCVPPYNGNNGGSTYPGVTASTITVAVPFANNQAQANATRAAAADTDTQDQAKTTAQNYLSMFEHHVQTYGRSVKLVYFTSSYNSNDSTAAQNAECQSDATYIAKQIKAFIAWDMRAEVGCTTAFQNTLANDGVLCFCTVTVPASYYLSWAPYVWGTGLPDETQGYLMRAEMICDEIAPYPPQFAGEADLNSPLKRSRTFGLVWPGASSLDNTQAYVSGAQFFAQKLKQCGVNLVDDVSFPIVDPNGPADAQTIMAKFKNDHVSDVIVVADPVDPVYLTTGATKQDYFPEWIDTGSALTDTTHFGRLYDQTQWRHAFGLSLLPDRVPTDLTDALHLYEWEYHGQPPATHEDSTAAWPFSFFLTTGISLAGPDLTPRTFQCGEPPYTSKTHAGWLGASAGIPCVGQVYPGLFGYPVSPSDYQSRVANSVVSWGSKLWPWDDYNIYDDATLIWWDPTATGPDESNTQGVGMWRYVNNGKRYLYGQFPKVNPPWFQAANTVTIFAGLPGPDTPPNYPYACYYMC